ncbi:2-(1,2-epoxy-1,2-dihydrophenyl)acetyl-CoA isomerase PaaG [Azospirillum rugosum]|uniref:2-(1,2-epoxy-1,2-dihydrophenyl)acetyl-CoA isomerase n=1 Tax=Azospirillum rugosum TaxID=416170 RepID=A0ABS4ST08_9PROT|nr:2-(1,2-epoxy-1,2-dihydrophenyl)acetyl-CoA isomerase PaaG [Azospirillum rugosum]MBP2295696.1 2-(1,2-epoxy-1,2-dihydrophenyl)acetyl-CoA isomerase [Azospirillum rugosum]MDQ0526759.1 2-(1,2-epoxy-1,2-dihydrophenyl)acetyl-CoA isomerase [Azospirillum rugosum]
MSSAMNYANILFEVADGVATLTLNRPDKLNSFTNEMHAEVRDALARVKGDPAVRCLLLTGAGRGFCAGQDLSDRAMAPGAMGSSQGPPDIGAALETNYNPLVRTLRGLEMPVVAAVNGVAAGAGANIALGCDLVLAAKSASFIQAFCRLGLIPDAGGTWLLPHRVGTQRAMALAMLGEKLSAEEAERIGLIHKAVDDAELMPTATALARQLATQPTRGLALTKRAIYAAATNTMDEQLDLERDLQREAGRTADYREGVTAFLEKRAPTFEGK